MGVRGWGCAKDVILKGIVAGMGEGDDAVVIGERNMGYGSRVSYQLSIVF
jgi:hypothetical protein